MNPGRELDALIAEKVFGFIVHKNEGMWESLEPRQPLLSVGGPLKQSFDWDGNCEDLNRLPHYSTDIAAAWEVVETLKLHKRETYFGSIKIWWSPDPLLPPNPRRCVWDPKTVNQWHVGWVDTIDGFDAGKSVCAPTLPHAICLAALKAVGYDPD